MRSSLAALAVFGALAAPAAAAQTTVLGEFGKWRVGKTVDEFAGTRKCVALYTGDAPLMVGMSPLGINFNAQGMEPIFGYTIRFDEGPMSAIKSLNEVETLLNIFNLSDADVRKAIKANRVRVRVSFWAEDNGAPDLNKVDLDLDMAGATKAMAAIKACPP